MIQLPELSILIRVSVGAVGTFCAILLWAKTRDVAWILVVTGVLLSYAGIIFDTLASLGLFGWEQQPVLGVPAGQLARLVLDNLPTLLYSAAFIVAVARRRVR